MLPSIMRNNWMPGIFDEFFGNNWLNERFNDEHYSTMPSVNIIEDKDEFRIDVAAPGLNKKDFAIDLHNNVLTVSSETQNKNEEEKDHYMRREFRYSSFSRSFTLPDTIVGDKIKAKHQDGILSIHIPKKEEAIDQGPKQISIS